MDFVLDTNILVHFIRSDEYIRKIIQDYTLFTPENSAFISIASVGEIKSLAFQFGWGQNKLERLSHFLTVLNPFPIDSTEISEAYADLDGFSQCCHPHYPTPLGMTSKNMGKNDLWIAATTMLLNATLLTTDTDFAHLSPQFFKMEIVQF
ncbi:MAG: type II toxin-antitoxin system VapC family toxin [Bacteroidota bacterium]